MRLLAIFIIIAGDFFRGFCAQMPDPYNEVGELVFVICLIVGVVMLLRETKKRAPVNTEPLAGTNWVGLGALIATFAGIFALYYWRMHAK